MSRHGYSDDFGCEDPWDMIRYRGQVESAIRGKRGQRLFREMVAALDAMPQKRLVARALEKDGEVCALGAVGRARGLDMSKIVIEDDDDYDFDEDTVPTATAALFDIAVPLAREVAFMNDDHYSATPEARWKRMRDWAARQIRIDPSELLPSKEPDAE